MEETEYLDYLNIPSTLYAQMEEDVAALYTQLNIHTYPVDPMKIASKLGYILCPFSSLKKEERQLLKEKDTDGFSYYDPNRKTYIIYYRPDSIKKRLRFTIGHEIGHIRMGHKGESELARRIADYYAAYLLAPSPWIGFAGCEDFSDVASAFDLSDPCASRCFARYERWSSISTRKDYERKLLSLMKDERSVM